MKPETDPLIDVLATKLDIAPSVVEGIVGDLARQKESGRSQAELAMRWGVGFGKLSTIRSMGKVAIAEIREGLITKKLVITNAVDDIIMDGLNDPEKVAKLSLKDASAISKNFTDSALNLSNGQVGAPQVQINIGDLKILMDRREKQGAYVPIREKLGKVVDV